MVALNLFLVFSSLVCGVVGGACVAGFGGSLIAFAVWCMVLWHKE